MNEKTLEEKLINICGVEKAQEIMTVLSSHFQLADFELKTYYTKVEIISDNTLEGTEVEIGRKRAKVPVHAIQWNIGGDMDVGQLKLTFL